MKKPTLLTEAAALAYEFETRSRKAGHRGPRAEFSKKAAYIVRLLINALTDKKDGAAND